MFAKNWRKLTNLFVAFALVGFFVTIGVGECYPILEYWGFKDYCYFGFNQTINFPKVPHQGISADDSLVGYWSMNEKSGNIIYDLSGNNNNGTLQGNPLPNRVNGNYDGALQFDGLQNYVTIGNPLSLNPPNSREITLTCWVKVNALSGVARLITKEGNYELYILPNGKIQVELNNENSLISSVSLVQLSTWTFIVFTYDNTLTNNRNKLFVDGVLTDKSDLTTSNITRGSSDIEFGARFNGVSQPLDGIIDDPRIYNRALSAQEIAEAYTMPDPLYLADYYNYNDPITNNTMLIYIDNPDCNSNNVAVVNCIDFFEGSRLAFQANNSATANVWTNLGQPAFTTGVWNRNNYTTTLFLDASSISELNWNTYNITTIADSHSSVSPSNPMVAYGGSQLLNFTVSHGFGFNVIIDGISQGQINNYSFDNVTDSHSVTITSSLIRYIITASSDLGSTISPSGDVSVNQGGSQLFIIQDKTGYNVKHVYVDNVDKGAISNYTFSNIVNSHVISVSSESISSMNSSTPTPTPKIGPSPIYTLIPTSTPVSSLSPEITNSTSLTTTSHPETNQFLTQTLMIAVVVIAVLIALFALALTKGYMTMDIVDEKCNKIVNAESESDRDGKEKENQDYSI